MENYAMLYEELALAPWGGGTRRSDPFRLGDADTFRAVDNKLSGESGVDARFGLFAAVTKIVVDNSSNAQLVSQLRDLQTMLTEMQTLDELCNVLDKMKPIFQEAGYTILS